MSRYLNKTLPYIMHIDLNSCFAIIEQQANRLLRGRPVGVAAYGTPRGFVLAASYEAKAKGIKLGVNNQQARTLCPDIVILTPDPAKYREAHRRFKQSMLKYTPDVVAKSIDEFVLDMRASPALRNRIRSGMTHNEAMLDIGKDMKAQISASLGEWVTVNIGIATNRFLAKYAAGFDKPDGMTLIDHTNLREKYTGVPLMDLPGINVRYRARLRRAGIYTPLEFLDAELNVLRKQVFKSIHGLHWYSRLRGYEVDAVEFSRKSIGHQYALPKKTTDLVELERLLMKLSEKTGRRLRKNNFCAYGIHLYLGFDQYRDGYSAEDAYVKKDSFTSRYVEYGDAVQESGEAHSKAYQAYGARALESKTQQSASILGVEEAGGFNLHKFRKWSHGEKTYHRLYSTLDIYKAAKKLLHSAEIPNNVKIMSVHVFNLQPWDPEQMNLFNMASNEKGQLIDYSGRAVEAGKRLSDSVDEINNRYGEFVITPGTMMEMSGEILDRIAFGAVRDM